MTDKAIGRMQLSFFSFESGQVPRRLLSKGLPDAELQKKMETGRCRNQEDGQTRFNRSSQVAKYVFLLFAMATNSVMGKGKISCSN